MHKSRIRQDSYGGYALPLRSLNEPFDVSLGVKRVVRAPEDVAQAENDSIDPYCMRARDLAGAGQAHRSSKGWHGLEGLSSGSRGRIKMGVLLFWPFSILDPAWSLDELIGRVDSNRPSFQLGVQMRSTQ